MRKAGKTVIGNNGTQKLLIGRRRLLQGLGGTAGLVFAPPFLDSARAVTPGSLFSLGVASGDPHTHSVVLWTRLAPDPLNGGGMGSQNISVQWEVSTDPGMASVIASGNVMARAADGHTVHVSVNG